MSSSAYAATSHVHFRVDPTLTVESAAGYCRTLNYVEDVEAEIFRFICNRKQVFVCSQTKAFVTTHPDAVRQCVILRAKFAK